MDRLPGDYIAGFVDGEGCFALKFRRDVRHERKNKPVYFYWDIEFVLMLRKDDKEILEAIRETLGCGRISVNKRGMARYAVNNINDLMHKIIPFFDSYHLRAKKRFDFELWKESLELLHKNRGLKTNISSTGNSRGDRKISWDTKDLEKLKKIQEKMRQYKSKRPDWKWIQRIDLVA